MSDLVDKLVKLGSEFARLREEAKSKEELTEKLNPYLMDVLHLMNNNQLRRFYAELDKIQEQPVDTYYESIGKLITYFVQVAMEEDGTAKASIPILLHEAKKAVDDLDNASGDAAEEGPHGPLGLAFMKSMAQLYVTLPSEDANDLTDIIKNADDPQGAIKMMIFLDRMIEKHCPKDIN